MLTSDEANRLINRKDTLVIVPAVIAVCAWILFTDMSGTGMLVFLAASGLGIGLSMGLFFKGNLHKAVMVSDDPGKLLNKKAAISAAIAVGIICIAGIITLFVK